MNERRTRDFAVGVFVLIGLCGIAYLSFTVGGLSYTGRGGLKLYATFDQIADLKVRAPVEIAGVPVGQVKGIRLNDDFRARVLLDVDQSLKLPVDSSASIVTSGLLGDRYIAIEIGAEDEFLRDGEEIAYTDSALVLERIIGKFLYNFDKGKDDDKKDE